MLIKRYYYTLYGYWVCKNRGIFNLFEKHLKNPVFKGFVECSMWCFNLGNNHKYIGVYLNVGQKWSLDEIGW